MSYLSLRLLEMRVSFFILLLAILAALLCTLYLIGTIRFNRNKRKAPEPYIRSIDFVCSSDTHDDFVDGVKFLFYIICHDQKSLEIATKWSKCMPWARTVFVQPSIFFESDAYSSVFPGLQEEWSNTDLVGVATYKSLKFVNIEKLKAYVELAYYRPYDVVPLYTSGEYLVPQAVKGHTQEFQSVWDAVLQRVSGLTEPEVRKFDDIEVFFRNSFIISPKWFLRLIFFMQGAMTKVQADPGLMRLLSSDAHYAEGKQPVAQRVFQQDYYQWFPFVFERLPVFFAHHAGAKVFTTQRQVSHFENTEQGMDRLFKGI